MDPSALLDLPYELGADVQVPYVVTASRWSMGGEVASAIGRLEEAAGAEVIELCFDRRRGRRFPSRFQTVRQSFTLRLLGLRNRWTETDRVLVIGWYLVPILILIRLRVLRRPRRLVSAGTFMHDARLRRVVNRLLRAFRIEGLEFISFSRAERANLIDVVGIPPERVHPVVYRARWSNDEAPDHDGGYVFTGGYTNRDYATFFAAVAPLTNEIITVASPHNELGDPPSNVDLRIGSPPDEFEQLVAACGVLVLPLRAGGEACGQTVLFSGIRHHRPVVATRHDALLDYLGDDYPGFVPAEDADALRHAIKRALEDRRFRDSLLAHIESSAQMLREMGDFEDDFVKVLAVR